MEAAASIITPAVRRTSSRAVPGPPRPRSGGFSELPSHFGLGACVLHLFFLLAGRSGPVGLPAIDLLVAGLGAAWILVRVPRPSPEAFPPPPPPADRSDRRWLLPAAILLAALCATTLCLPLYDWEARIHWALKAKMLAADPTLAAGAFRDPYRLHIHPRYPLLVPFLASLVARHQGEFLEAHYQILIAVFSLLAAWQLRALLLRLARPPVANALAAVAAFSGAWLSALFGSQVEVALAFFLVLALDRMIRWFEGRRAVDLAFAGVFLFGCAMTKNEGLLLGVAALLSFFAAALGEEGPRGAGRATALLGGVFLLLSSAWFACLPGIPPVSDEHYLSRLSLAVLARGVDRLPAIGGAILSRVADLPRWHLLWLIPPFAVVRLFRKPFRADPMLRLPLLLAGAYLAGLLAIYMVSPWHDIGLQVRVSFDRAALPLLPLFAAIAARALGDG